MLKQNRGRIIAISLLALVLFGIATGISIAAQENDSTGAVTGNPNSGRKEVGELVYNIVHTDVYSGQNAKVLNLSDAIKLAMDNNPEIKSLKQDIKIREQDLRKARYYADKLKDVEDKSEQGEELLTTLKQQLASIPDPDDPVYKDTYDYLAAQIALIEDGLQESAPYRIDNYENAKVAYLYEKQAETGLRITRLAEKAAEQKIALLVSKQYFDVIKYKQIEEVKRLAYERAVRQAEAAHQSYEIGFRAKDDYLLAKAQADLMKADYIKAQLDAVNAETELKATIGMEQATQISLDEWQEPPLKPELNRDLTQGLEKRLEIQKAMGELEIAKLGFDIAASYLGPGVIDYEQAKIGVTKAEIEVDKQKTKVEKEIRQAYETLLTTGLMKQTVASTAAAAQESADIAEYRFKEGYGIPSPIMKALNAEDLAGTTVEVLAAEEKYMEVKEKIIEINYSYNLAKVNYLLSIGEGL